MPDARGPISGGKEAVGRDDQEVTRQRGFHGKKSPRTRSRGSQDMKGLWQLWDRRKEGLEMAPMV